MRADATAMHNIPGCRVDYSLITDAEIDQLVTLTAMQWHGEPMTPPEIARMAEITGKVTVYLKSPDHA